MHRSSPCVGWCSYMFTITTEGLSDRAVDHCRGAMLAVLQRMASSKQGSPCPGPHTPSPAPGTVPSKAAVALQQRQLQQLLYQHSQPPTSCQARYNQQKPTPAAQAAAFGSWPWQCPASATLPIAPPSSFSPQPLIQPPEDMSSFTADQQACPQLDGSFLAECIKPPAPVPCVLNRCNRSIQLSSQLLPANQAVLSAGHASAAAALAVHGRAETEPSAIMVSPLLSFSSLPSTGTPLSAASKAELTADLRPDESPYDCFGMPRSYIH